MPQLSDSIPKRKLQFTKECIKKFLLKMFRSLYIYLSSIYHPCPSHTHTHAQKHTYIFIKHKWKYAIHTSLILLFSLKSDLGHLSISAHGDIPYFSLFLMIKSYSIHSKVSSEKLPCAWRQARYLEVELRRTLQHTPP